MFNVQWIRVVFLTFCVTNFVSTCFQDSKLMDQLGRVNFWDAKFCANRWKTYGLRSHVRGFWRCRMPLSSLHSVDVLPSVGGYRKSLGWCRLLLFSLLEERWEGVLWQLQLLQHSFSSVTFFYSIYIYLYIN